MKYIRQYWYVAIILVVGGAVALWAGFVNDSWAAAGWAGGITGVLTGMAVAAAQGRAANADRSSGRKR